MDGAGPQGSRTSNITFDLCRHARITPDAPALLLRDRDVSYRDLDDLVWRVAQHLHDCGVRPGHVIALLFAREFTLIATMLAVTRLGATVFSVPRSTTHFQRRSMMVAAGVTILATDHPGDTGCTLPSLRVDLRTLHKEPARVDERILASEPAAPWLIITGSGSTGEPKRMAVPHEQANARSALAFSWLALTPDDRVVTLSHPEFTAPKHRLLEVLRAGASFGIFPDRNERPLACCERHRISVLHATVFHVESILADTPGPRHPARALRLLSIGASVVAPGLRERIRRDLGVKLLVRYASNEAGPIAVAVAPAVHDVPGTVGKPLDGVELEIVDDTMRPLETGATGLIRLKSPCLIDGYLDNEDANREFFRDGWFLPGDLGRMTPDGQLIHFGRADQMMIFNGINICPAEIEAVLCSHPCVRDAAAMPLESRIHQDVPVCAICLQDGQPLPMRELEIYAAERLGFKAPRKIIQVDRIPRNESGKLIRAELRKTFLEHLAMARTERSQ